MSAEDNFTFETMNTKDLSLTNKTKVFELFSSNYRCADLNYIDDSLQTLSYIAMAFEDEKLIGFSLADALKIPIPRCHDEQYVALGGIGCVDLRYRRRRLVSRLASMAGTSSGLFNNAERVLACSRVAHPASFRLLSSSPYIIPKIKIPLSSWHLEVAEVIASFYGVELKPNSLVVKGRGLPIGYPNVELDVGEDEMLPFIDVDRDQGDSLLAIAWAPDAPEGW